MIAATSLRRAVRAHAPWLTALLAVTACATAPKLPPPEISWPRPPEKARVKFVRAFQNEDQLGAGTGRKLFKALVPSASDAFVGQPTGLALSGDERTLYIASAPLGRLLAVERDTGLMRRFATVEGRHPQGPFGAAVDAEENVYVSDSVANVVWAYTRKGDFLRKFGSEHLERPTGLAVDPRRKLVYVVSGVSQTSKHHRVEVFSLTGEHLRTIGTRGSGAGEFLFPSNVAVAKDGTLYVVDMLNFRIQVFDPDGQLVSMFGEEGAGSPGTFDKAKGLALDAFGNIYVTDSRWGHVQMFNARHQVLMAFSGQGNEPGSMRLPTAIVIDTKNTIFVADYWSHTVNEFQLVNTTAEDSLKASGSEIPEPPPPPVIRGHIPQGG
jgi:DNA-binding beta-propeller fold protein YncE